MEVWEKIKKRKVVIEMAIYHRCKSCDNSEEGDKIYQCEKCGKVFCKNCSERSGVIFMDLRDCPACGGRGSSIGCIESESPDEEEEEDDDDEEYSSYDPDPKIQLTLFEIREYLEKPREKQSSEILGMIPEALLTLNWSKYPEAKSLYYKICPRPSSYSSSLSSSESPISSPSHSSSFNLNDELDEGMKTGFNFLIFIFVVVAVFLMIANAVEKHKLTNPKSNSKSVALSDIARKLVEEKKLAGDAEIVMPNNEVATNIEKDASTNEPIIETPLISSVPAQGSFNGTVEYIEPVNLYIRSTGHVNDPVIPDIGEKAKYGLRIFVRLDNGHKATIIMDYDGNFNSEDRVSVISRSSESNGTIKDVRYFMTYIGIIDSEITIRLDNGGKVVIIFPGQEVIFSKGERVRAISSIIK